MRAELRTGFEALAGVRRGVAVFGSARTREGHPSYELAREIGRALGEAGFCVITGGGPGAMEAANRGAREAGAQSVGLTIDLPSAEPPNPYLDLESTSTTSSRARSCSCATRARSSCCPAATGRSTSSSRRSRSSRPARSASSRSSSSGRDFWCGLVDWLRERMLAEGTISEHDLDLLPVTDSVDEVVAICREASRPGVELARAFVLGTVTAISPDRDFHRTRLARVRSLDDTPFGVAVVGPDGRVEQVNEPLCELLGREQQDLVGCRLEELLQSSPRATARRRASARGRGPTARPGRGLATTRRGSARHGDVHLPRPRRDRPAARRRGAARGHDGYRWLIEQAATASGSSTTTTGPCRSATSLADMLGRDAGGDGGPPAAAVHRRGGRARCSTRRSSGAGRA